MEAFETIRSIAAELHAKLVLQGADPDKPMLMIQAATRHFDLELVWLPTGDPALKGARALFDHQSGLICCADEGDDEKRACLIAHELGHAAIHTDSSECTREDIDLSRSTEAAPVGLQRVEDYGVHERRELQANVFAREFLLPRSSARMKHLGGETALSIARSLKLPLDLIRQQLLDALLLPQAPAEEEKLHTPARPDPSQDRAAQHRGSAFQLQAGPGTGKTRTLVKRVLSLLADGIDPASILVLTYSNRATGELLERLSSVAPQEAPRLWIGTFHAFGLDLIRRYSDKMGLPADPPLFDRSDAIEVLEEILPTLPLVHYRNLWDPAMVLREIIGAVSRAKDELVDAEHYRVLAQMMVDTPSNSDGPEKAAKALEVAQVYKLYEEALRARGAVDFGDLIMRPTLLLETDKSVRTAIQLRHRHVLVDEYQDVNRASARLLRALAGDGSRLWVVGDARQSIYRFRGASSVNMTRFLADYPNAIVDRLKVNYRSSEEIIATYQAFAPRMAASQGMLPLDLTSSHGASGIRPELRRFETLEDEEAGIAASIREIEATGVPLRNQAVLCRTNARLNEIAEALEVRGIPVLHLGSLFERDEIRDLLALLSLAVDPFGDALARVGAMLRYDIPLQDIHCISSCMRNLPGKALGKLRDLAAEPRLSSAGRDGLTRLANDLDGLVEKSSPWAFLTSYLLDRTDMLARLARLEGVRDRMRGVAIWQFLNFVRERSPVNSGAPIQRTLDRVRQLVLLAEERDLRQIPAGALHMDAVSLMTVHGSKGLEFDAVHIPGLTVSSFPSSNRGQRCPPPRGMIEADGAMGDEDTAAAHATEEECLFFVALSRARSHLRLYHARKQPNGNNRTPSPFLNLIASRVTELPHPPIIPFPADAPVPKPVLITWPGDWSVTDTRLRGYQKCPRRFFYTHVLGLGGSRKTTPFGQTHDCLYEFIRWLNGARLDGSFSEATAAEMFEQVWSNRGPVEHGFAKDYRQLADRLVAALVRAGAGLRFRQAEPLTIDFAAGQVVVRPDEMTEAPDGRVILRHVRTGYKRDSEYDRLEYTLYHLAAQARYGTRYSVEALHLTDETLEPVTITPRKMSNRKDESAEMMANIGRGHFPTRTDAVTCPRCPHFFVCAAVGRGPLVLT